MALTLHLNSELEAWNDNVMHVCNYQAEAKEEGENGVFNGKIQQSKLYIELGLHISIDLINV